MIFRQLSEPESCTYTYLLACSDTRQAVLVDPVLETVERDLAVLQELELELAYTLETHIHADHITSAARLRVADRVPDCLSGDATCRPRPMSRSARWIRCRSAR